MNSSPDLLGGTQPVGCSDTTRGLGITFPAVIGLSAAVEVSGQGLVFMLAEIAAHGLQ
jgi:hypothetical protein